MSSTRPSATLQSLAGPEGARCGLDVTVDCNAVTIAHNPRSPAVQNPGGEESSCHITLISRASRPRRVFRLRGPAPGGARQPLPGPARAACRLRWQQQRRDPRAERQRGLHRRQYIRRQHQHAWPLSRTSLPVTSAPIPESLPARRPSISPRAAISDHALSSETETFTTGEHRTYVTYGNNWRVRGVRDR